MKKDNNSNNTTKWLILVAGIAVVAVILVVAFQTGLIGANSHKVKLEDGSVISFARISSISKGESKIDADERELTKEEIGTLFGGLSVAGTGYFDKEDGSIIGVSGILDDMQLIMSVSGNNIKDIKIKGKTDSSYVKGVPVSAGYVVTGGSSQNKQTIIYFATLELNGSSVYLEHSGSYEDRNTIRNEIASAIEDLAQLGELGLILIKK